MLIYLEEAIEVNGGKSGADIWFVFKEVGFNNSTLVEKAFDKRFVNFLFMSRKVSHSVVQGNVNSGVMMVNVTSGRHGNLIKNE